MNDAKRRWTEKPLHEEVKRRARTAGMEDKIKGAVAALEEWRKMNTDMVCCLHTQVSIPQKEKTNQHKAYKHRNNNTKFRNILLRRKL